MARTAKHPINLEEVFAEDGTTVIGWRLFGYINGKQIRRQGGLHKFEEFDKEKREIEKRLEEQAILEAERPTLVPTVLTREQIKDATAAFRLIEGRGCTLLEAVAAGLTVTGTAGAKDAWEAFEEYKANQTKRELADATTSTNNNRIQRFLEITKVKLLGEISSKQIEKYVLDDSLKPNAKLARGRPLCAWLNWCCEKRHGDKSEAYLRESPYKINTKELGEIAARDTIMNKKIYTAAQCEKLLKAAIDWNDGELVPYTVLSLWCYMRSAEVLRTKIADIHLDTDSEYEGPYIAAYGRKKGSNERAVSIPENVVPILRQCIERGILRSDWWHPIEGKPTPAQIEKNKDTGDIPFSRHGWDVVRENAGLVEFSDITNPLTKNQPLLKSDWQANILRHTGESYARRRKNDLAHVAESAGHSKTTALKHYLRLPQRGDTDKFYNIRLMLPGRTAPLAKAKAG